MRKPVFLVIPLTLFTLAGCGAQASSPPVNHQTDQTASSVTSPITSALAPAPAPQPVILHQGSQGEEVSKLQSQLADLGYLPLTYQGGETTWKYDNTPVALKDLWQPGQFGVLTKGAVMQFQRASNLPVDGSAGPQTMFALDQAEQAHVRNPYGYSYVDVSKGHPETLTLWKNGGFILTTRANTGVNAGDTPDGTWPVYQRYVSQEMRGTDSFGNSYDDPGVPWVNYYYGGDAVHGFERKAYGYPQSAGCVEVPVDTAKVIYVEINYGTLVHVHE